MSLIQQEINGQNHLIRSPATTVTCNGTEYYVNITLNLNSYTVGTNVDIAAATEHFEEIERNRVNQAITCAFSFPHYDTDGNIDWSLTDQCKFLTEV
jgi:hypothetical protein